MKSVVYSPQQHTEWLTWRLFCERFFEATGLDMDHERCNGIVDVIKLWGEELAELRKEHPISLDVLNKMREETPVHTEPELEDEE